MAIIGNGILGPIRKGIGSVVGYTLNGQNVLRSKAATYRDKKSDDQVIQRTKLQLLVAFARLVLGVCRTSFSSRVATQSGYNAFISANLNDFVFPVPGDRIDFTEIKISKGSKLPLIIDSIVADALLNQISVIYPDNSNGSTGLATDRVKLVVYNYTKNLVFESLFTDTRHDQLVKVSVPVGSLEDGDEIYGYVFAASAIGETPYAASDSVVESTVAIA